MKIWTGTNPFATSVLHEHFRDGNRVYSFCLPNECDEEYYPGLPNPLHIAKVLYCSLFVREHRRVGCHHQFCHPDFLDIEYIRDGNLFFRQNETTYLAEPGDICLIRPDSKSDIITGPAGFCDKSSISIYGPILSMVIEQLGLLNVDVITPKDGCLRIEKCFEQLEHCMKNQTAVAGERIAGLCLELLEVVAHWEIIEADNPEMSAIKACMERHIGTPFSIPQLAQELRMSPSTLIRRCRQLGNVTPIQLMTRLRMSRAATMLLDNKARINEIATSLGYDNALNFSTAFKAFFGSSPRNFRKKHLLYH